MKHQPVWINEEEVARWLGVSIKTVQRYRQTLRLHYTYLHGTRNPMYDKQQIEEMLNKNSTYKILGI